MVLRKIVHIDEEKCNGCGRCVPACAEGAIEIIDGKARLASDKYCDGFGACLGHCPQGAITIEEREAEEFDKEAVKSHLQKVVKEAPQLPMTVTHSDSTFMHHTPHHAAHHASSCPSSAPIQWNTDSKIEPLEDRVSIQSMLSQWPVKLSLAHPSAPFFQGRELVVVADCVPVAYGNFHQDFLKGKSIVIGCPKLDDIHFYVEKLSEILSKSDVKGVEVVHMEVPCCFSFHRAAEKAIELSRKNMPLKDTVIGVRGDVKGGGINP